MGRLEAIGVVLLALGGCVGVTVPSVPFGYDKVQDSPQFLTEDLFSEMVHGRWTREAVTRQLGEPDATNEAARTIGYTRCVESTAREADAIVLPLPKWESIGEVAHCQLIKLWLDEEDRVKKWEDRVGIRPNRPEDERQYYSLPCRLDDWIAGGPCLDPRSIRHQRYHDQGGRKAGRLEGFDADADPRLATRA